MEAVQNLQSLLIQSPFVLNKMIKDRKSLNVIKLTILKLIRKGTSGMLFESDLQEFVAKLPNNFSAKKFWLTVFLLKHRRFQVNFSGNLSSYFLYGLIHQ